MLDNIGGTSALLGLIAMAKDIEGLYAAVKAIVCVVRSHKSAMWDMDRIRGYQVQLAKHCISEKRISYMVELLCPFPQNNCYCTLIYIYYIGRLL